MKYVVVIALLALLLFLFYRKLRPYLKSIRDFINTIRQFQNAVNTPSNRASGKGEKLVRCETCGTWVPAGRTLSAGSGNAVFCSSKCLTARNAKA